MEEGEKVTCPVCTLYLRCGITLSEHLKTHPKESVIDAFVKVINTQTGSSRSSSSAVSNENGENRNDFNSRPVIYEQFVNNYGAVTNGKYHNTVITSNVANLNGSLTSSASLIPVIINADSQIRPAQTQVDNYNQPQVQIHNYSVSHNLHVASNSSLYRPFSSYNPNVSNKDNYSYQVDPLSHEQGSLTSHTHQASNSVSYISQENNFNSFTNSLLEPSTSTEGRNLNEIERGIPEAQKRNDEYSNIRRVDSSSSPCSETYGDFLDLDNQNCETNIGTVISNSHQVISSHEYNPTEVNSNSNLLSRETIEESNSRLSPSENILSRTCSPHKIETYENAEFDDSNLKGVRVNQSVYLLGDKYGESEINYNDDNSSAFSSASRHSSMESLSSASDEEFVICDDVEAARARERKELCKESEAESSSFVNKQEQNDRIGLVDDIENENEEEDSLLLSPIINIETDELMPPHGELSGQDSLSAADENSVWSNHYENASSRGAYEIFFEIKQEGNNREREARRGEVETEDRKMEKCPTCSISLSHGDRYKLHIETCSMKKDISNIATSSNSKEEIETNIETKFQDGEILHDEKKKFKCICCSVEVSSLKQLSTHVSTAHNLSLNQCPTCLQVFTSSIDFKLHIRTMHPLECTVCGKYFNSRAGLQLHRKRHLKVRPYICSICSKSFVTRQKLKEHMNVHLGKAPLKCKLCPNETSFKSYSNLIQHRRVVHAKLGKKIKDYFCDCGQIFHSKKRLFWHSEIHGKPKSCKFCSRKFIHLSSLTRHIRRTHDENYLPTKDRVSENVTCPVCDGTFLRTSLVSHMQTHSGKKPHLCDICNKSFTTKWNLNAHRWIHMSRKLKPHKCKLCNAAFINLSDFQAHERSHTKTRPFSCNHCGKQFIHQYNCIRHVREHEQEKRFACDICNKSFHRSYYLSEHLKIHSGLKPFSCHICGKASTTKSNHNKHIRTHHAREPVSSEV